MPIQYVPFHPEPIQGQALLDNFTRTRRALKYRDNDKPAQRILRGMPLYEVDKVEQMGDNPNGSLLIRGECLSACAYLKAQGIQVDLVYIDPPFASGANYAKRIYLRRNPKVAQAIEAAEHEMDDDDLRAFEETMYGDIWTKESYLNWMYENLMAIKSVMSHTASIYIHLDWHIGHYVKVLMDDIFGEDNFLNEIIYCYTGPTNQKRNFPRKHDAIFLYICDKDNYCFNGDAIRVPFKKSLKSGGKTALTGKASDEELEDLDAKGKIPEDWWTDIPDIGKVHSEDLGYSTQKPEALLKRIIEASSNAGMVVADFFGGSGVTAKVAYDLGRTFIHVDVGINSIQTARDRLKSAGASFNILEVRDGVAIFRNPAQTMEKLAALIPGLGKSAELNPFWAGAIQDGKDGIIPVYLPNLLDHREKLLDLPLLNRIVNEQISDLPDGVKKVMVYYVDIEDEKESRAFLREYGNPLVDVELHDLKAVLHEIVLNDEFEYTVTETADDWRMEITRFYSDRLAQKIDAHNQKLQRNAGKNKARQKTLDESVSEGDEEAPATFATLEISENGLELVELISLDCTAAEGIWHSDSEIKIDKKGYVIRNGEKTKDFWDGTITSTQKPLRLKIRNIAGDETIVAVM